jgi:tetratricopeptide (TPR) repeat protein
VKRRPAVAALAVVQVLSLSLAAEPSGSSEPPATMEKVYDLAYNLDYPEAYAEGARLIAERPNDPMSYRAVAATAWMEMVFRRGAASIDHYLGNVTETQFNVPKPAPELDRLFQKNIDKSIAISDAAVAAHPNDPQALYDSGAAWALKGGYAAAVLGSITGAFKAGRRAYNTHERVLEIAPGRAEANFVVGGYRYAISTFGVATRMVAYVAGFGGGREKGIAMLEIASKKGISQSDAIFALAVIYSREGRHAEAVEKLRELERRYPRNRLLILEEGAALIRAGHADTANEVLTAGLARLDQDTRPRFPGERAQWLYKRGLARLNWNHRTDAEADLNTALGAEPVGWVRGRIHVELGKLADLAGNRSKALSYYTDAASICSRSNDPACEAEAERFKKRAFALQ